MIQFFIFLVLFSIDGLAADAGRIRMRAREHFEIHRYKLGEAGQTGTFKGLTNTINIWYEKPFEYSFGLALGPVIGGARADKREDVSPSFGERIQLAVAGLEGKFFPTTQFKGFLRAGLSWNSLKTNGTYGRINGYGYYAGLGWEFPVGRVAIAPEVAVRRVHLSQKVTGEVFTPSVGIHFYSK